jgi:DNA-binding IclR family transcriptional regulator
VARTGQPAVRRVAAVERALAVLDALAAAEPDLGTNELARRTGINASTTSRLLATLAAHGLVAYVPETGRYRLGRRLVELGHKALGGADLRELARPHLLALVAATGETATLSVGGETDAITIDFALSPASVQSVARLGRPSVAHATATGKVLLAFDRRELPPEPLRAYTQRTITSREALADELERVRARGFAVAVGEREEDLNAVAAPVFGADGALAAILSVQGPAPRFGGREREAALPALREHAEALAASLGASGRSARRSAPGAGPPR